MNRESGFTLIEVIVSLVLVGMMAAIAGMGIVTGTKGYVLAKENSHMAQKAQIAMARIQRELMELTDIAATQNEPAFIVYDNTSGRHAIARDDTTVKMYFNLGSGAMSPPMDAGDILVDNVNNFTLSYFQGTNVWGGLDIQRLSTIKADLALDRSDGSGNTVTFTTTVNPRNTNNYGGVPPTATPNTAHNYSCFVATAAYGDASFSTVFLFSFLIIAPVFISFIFVTQRHRASPSATHGKQRLNAKGPVLRSRRRSRKKAGGREAGKLAENRGNVLIGLIVTMMIFAALGAGMVAMTGTSTSSQVTANTTSKAYYLAESGFRYAASEYLNVGDTDTDGEIEDDRNLVLVNLDGSTFTFVNPDERFSLEVYPYYFVTSSSHNVGDTLLHTNFPGNIPDDFSMPPTGRLRIGSGIYNYTGYSGGTFTLATGLLEAISDNMNVNPVGNPSAGATMTNGGDLTLSSASFFPAITGKFMMDGIAYTYKTKNGNILENITDANHPAHPFSIHVDATTDVVLKPYLRIFSTGTVGQVDQAASRQIVYNVPIPDPPTGGEKVEFHDQFDDTSHWNASTWGTHAVQSIGGDSALKVTSTTSAGGIEASLIGLDWSSTNVSLQYAQSVSGYFLSYDAQVKVGFVPPTVPDNFDADYAAGLSFRLDGNNNSYGISFMEADTSSLVSAVDPDIVPKINVTEPLYDIPMIVLWQQINSGEDRQYLAYTFGTDEFSDDMENPLPPPGWTAEGTWARDQPGGPLPSGTWCWKSDLSGALPGTVESLITPAMNLSDAPSAVLTFWHKVNFNDPGDIGSVIVDGSTVESFSSSDPQDIWRQEALIIPVGNIQVEFRIERGDGSVCDWHIDDVTIHRGFPVNESTLLVRIKEAAEVRFTSGETTPEDGDIVTQANGAYGTVIGEPILSGGAWASGNAAGIITLNKVSATDFQSGQALAVAGKGSNLATCQGYIDRYNYIKVFYSDIDGYGIPNTDPFDAERRENSRNTVHWPPDEIQDWSAERDYFTLVQWDGLNSVDLVESTDEPGVIVLGTESILFTPVSGLPLIRPELGLHTFGSNSTDVYFDDFGLLVEIAPGSGFLTPIQE